MSGIASRQLRHSVLKKKKKKKKKAVDIWMVYVFHTVRILMGLNELEPL
jgi:hypothetical protein